MRFRILLGAAVLMVASSGAAVLGSDGIASAHPAHPVRPMPYTCTGGSIPSGNYSSITISGACNVVPDAVINVLGNINVAARGVFDAQSAPSTITVGHDVTADRDSLLGLGCLPNPTPTSGLGHPCTVEPDGSSNITVNGDVTAWDANAVLLNGITVNRNVTLIGSKGTATATERATAIPWAIKNNTIGGNLIVSDMTPIWVGLLLNKVGGNVILTHIHITDGLPTNPPTPPDMVDTSPTIRIGGNTVGRNLICWGLGPNVAGGFSPALVNTVGGHSIGQCADLAV